MLKSEFNQKSVKSEGRRAPNSYNMDKLMPEHGRTMFYYHSELE